MISNFMNYFLINSIIVAFMAFFQYFNSHQFWNIFMFGMIFNFFIVLSLYIIKKRQLHAKEKP